MWNLNYDKISDIIKVLETSSLAMNKKLGQNFLINKYAREQIAFYINANENTSAWEIGPGLGAITSLVLETKAKVKCFELDKGFCRILKEEAFIDEKNFSLIEGDALKNMFKMNDTPDIIYGNLPYNVGSVCIAKLIEESILPEKMIFTLQKEVVDRMKAEAKSKDYSSFSLLCQLDYEVTCPLTISKSCFYPEPKVESAVVLMRKRKESLISNELRPVFLTLIKDLFHQRRKTIKNNLLSSKLCCNLTKENLDNVIKNADLLGSERAETLEFNSIISLASSLSSLKSV